MIYKLHLSLDISQLAKTSYVALMEIRKELGEDLFPSRGGGQARVSSRSSLDATTSEDVGFDLSEGLGRGNKWWQGAS